MDSHHRFGGQVGLELGANDAAVAVRARDLPPYAAVVGPLRLGLRLVDVGHSLPAVPRHLLLRVHALDLDERRVLILVRFRSKIAQKKFIKKLPKLAPKKKKDGSRSILTKFQYEIVARRYRVPLVSEDRPADVQSAIIRCIRRKGE